MIKKCAKTHKRLMRMANQAKLHSFRTKPIYMCGVLVPQNYDQAVEIDHANGNRLWQDATDLELRQIDDYEAFKDKGRDHHPGPGHKKTTAHLVHACKHDGRRKARLVAGGHLTDTPIDPVYSSVVSLRAIRILTFIAELNDLETWCTDIGNTYLESYTQERIYIVAGKEFGDREGHILIIREALYGLKSSGLRWSERLAACLQELDYFSCKNENDAWMKDCRDHCECIAVHVDDLVIVSRDPKTFVSKLEDVCKFKLKGTGPIEFHLGCDDWRDKDGALCHAPRKYIEKCTDNYKRLFGTGPKMASSPLPQGDHPELDTSELLDLEKTQIYQSLIGSLQWTIQLGRFDVSTAVMPRTQAEYRHTHTQRL